MRASPSPEVGLCVFSAMRSVLLAGEAVLTPTDSEHETRYDLCHSVLSWNGSGAMTQAAKYSMWQAPLSPPFRSHCLCTVEKGHCAKPPAAACMSKKNFICTLTSVLTMLTCLPCSFQCVFFKCGQCQGSFFGCLFFFLKCY